MNESKRYLSVLLCICMVVASLVISKTCTMDSEEPVNRNNDSLVVWYTDDTMTDYLSQMAVEYNEKHHIRVLPKLQSGDDYIESIYNASIDNESAPDLYIVSNDALEKAVLSGTAIRVDETSEVLNETNFPQAALSAVTYDGQQVAYPYYFETSALIYNKTYLHDMASDTVEALNADNPENTEGGGDEVESEETQEDITDLPIDEQIEIRMNEAIPVTFDDLLSFANDYNAPETVESVFKWDVRDLFYNFFFIGNYVDLGGVNGDNIESINLYNLDAISALKVYQDMNQFFSFESEDVTYDQVVEDFIQGKLVFATVTTDIVAKLKEATEAGDFQYEYGLTMIPDLNDEMDTRSLSVTNALVVNGYSDKIADANGFARFLCMDNAATLYEKTGKLPSKSNTVAEDDASYAFVEEYTYSVPMPKMMATSNFWLKMEDTFAKVWSGKDASGCLKELSEQVKMQITGSEVQEEYIEAKTEEESIEYLDEEALKEEAMNEEE